MSLQLPRLDSSYGNLQVWWEEVCQALEAQDSSQESALNSISQALQDAGIAFSAAQQRMPSLPAWTVALATDGSPRTGQLPRNIQFRRYEGGDEVTLDSEWSASLLAGSATFAVGASNGLLELTDVDATSVIEVMSIRDDVPLTTLFNVQAVTSANLASINSASHATISDVLVFKTGATGTLTLSANLDVLTADASPTGSFPVFGKWQVDNGGYTDAAAEVESAADATITESPTEGEYLLAKGQLIVGATVTGLTANTEYSTRFQARNSSGTRTMYFNGTLSGVGT